MLRVHRFVPALLLGTLAISVSACGNKPAPKPNTASVAAPVETGPDLFLKLPMPKAIARDTGAEPIIASQAVVQFDQRIQVPSEVDGRVEIIGTPLPADHKLRTLPNVILTPHLGASTEEAQEKCGIEVAEVITGFLLTGEVRNAVNLPGVDAKTYELVRPYLVLGEKMGSLLGQLAPANVDRVYITFGGKAQELPGTDSITRAVLKGFLSHGTAVKGINNVNVRSAAAALGLSVEEKKSDEPVTFNEWLHVQLFSGAEKVLSAGGTFFGSPNNPRIVRLYSQTVEIVPAGILFLMNNKDRPGIVGHIGSLMGKHNVNIASMSLSRDVAGGNAMTILSLDSIPPQALIEEIQKDPDISNVKVVQL